MHTSEVHVGQLTCTRLEIGTHFKKSDKSFLNRLEQAARQATSIQSDAHYLGASYDVVVQLSTSALHEMEAKQSHFQSVKIRFLDLSLPAQPSPRLPVHIITLLLTPYALMHGRQPQRCSSVT